MLSRTELEFDLNRVAPVQGYVEQGTNGAEINVW